MNTRFPVLSTISQVLIYSGWALVIIAGIVALYFGMLEPGEAGHAFGTPNALWVGLGILAAVLGLITAAFGEVIGVLFAIEENTRLAAENAKISAGNVK